MLGGDSTSTSAWPSNRSEQFGHGLDRSRCDDLIRHCGRQVRTMLSPAADQHRRAVICHGGVQNFMRCRS
jgi:hypothetical protein